MTHLQVSDNKPRGHSGTASFYHQDDRSNPCTDGQLADPQRDQDAWIRMDRAQENALKIAHFLEKQEYVTRVLYPGLESHPGYELMKKQARGFGSILTF